MSDEPLPKQSLAAIDLLRRTGMSFFELRYSDENYPVVWMAVAGWLTDRRGRPVAHGRPNKFEAAGALTPELAVYRLCDVVIDGATCAHCGRPTGFETSLDSMPLPEHICWYQYDPELDIFRRGCE